MLGIQPKTLHMVGKHSTAEQHCQAGFAVDAHFAPCGHCMAGRPELKQGTSAVAYKRAAVAWAGAVEVEVGIK